MDSQAPKKEHLIKIGIAKADTHFESSAFLSRYIQPLRVPTPHPSADSLNCATVLFGYN
jgi:hypothetical protein